MSKNNSGKTLAIALVAVLVAAGGAWYFTRNDSQEPDRARTPSEISGQREYRNGRYSATGEYRSPAGREEVSIELALEDGIITEAEFQGTATNPTSVRMQGLFGDGFESAVVGQPVDSLSLTVVNGSSLTPRGFNEALEKIKNEAEFVPAQNVETEI